MGFPILSLITYLPIVGALIIIFGFKRHQTRFIKYFATAVAAVDMVISFFLLPYFNTTTWQFQFVERASWIPTIGVQYFFGIDGISVLLVLLTTVLGLIGVVCSYSAIKEREKEYYVCLLFLQTGMLGVFCSLDFFLFYIFWEIMLVPMYFLIGVWGGGRKLYSAIKFFLYTLFGSVLMLLGILALYFYNHSVTGVFSFSIPQMFELSLPFNYQFWIFLAFFVGFAIKVPMFPFHTWLPDAHTDAPTAGSVILAGVLLKMGTYGFLRFNLPIMPEGSRYFVTFMVVLSIIGIIYGALVAMAQKDVKRLIAYSSVSHLGFVMLGTFALTPEGLMGGLLQQINHGISTGALFLIVGIIYERRHTRMISDFGGLSKQMPIFATIFAITMFSSIGLPGLNGFVGEFLILVGAFKVSWVWALFAVTGIVLGAAYMLWLYQRVMFGELDKPENQVLTDCNLREILYMAPLIVFMFWIGLYPKPYLKIMEPTIMHLVERVNPEALKAPGIKFAHLPAIGTEKAKASEKAHDPGEASHGSAEKAAAGHDIVKQRIREGSAHGWERPAKGPPSGDKAKEGH
jgi:NADH-quinone oxidoreductase subunit M